MAKTPVTPEILAQRKKNAQMVSDTAVQTPATPVAPIKTAEEVQYDILPTSVTGAKKTSVVDSINALKAKQTAVQPVQTTQPTPTLEVAQPITPTETPVQPAPVQPTPTPTPANVEPAKVEAPVAPAQTPTAAKTPEQVSKESKTGNQLRENLAKYRTGQELFNAVKGGLIREGTREYNYLAQANPDLVNQYKTYQQDQVKKETINTLGNIVIGNTIEAKPVKTSDQFLEYFAQGLDDDLASTYAQNVTNNPEYLKAVKTLDDINTQIADNNKNINALYTDVRASLSSSTPESMVASRIAREAKPLIEKGMYLAELAGNAESSMNRIYDANKENFEIQMEDRNQKRQMAFQLYGTTRAEEIRQEDIEREDERLRKEIAREEALYGREKSDRLEELKKQEESNLMIGLLDKGIDPTGMSPEEMRKSYAGAVQSETNYERSLNQANLNLDYAKLQKSADAGDGTPAPQFTPVFNEDGTMKISDSSVYNLAIGPDGNSVQVQGVQEGGYAPNGRVECGAFVNDLIGVKIFGNKLSDKTKNINSNEPVVGGAFIEDVGPYGHVGFIESINEDGSINIIDSNYSKDTDGKIRRDTIAVGSPRWNQIKGFYDPSVGGAKPLDSNQRIIANAEKSAFRGNAVVKAFEEGLQQYKDIVISLNDESGPGDTAGIFQFMKSLDPTSVVRESEFDAAAKSAGVLEYIGNTYDRVMKGKKLSPEQAMAFKRLAKAYVGNRAESYNRLYDDMARSLDNQGIHQSYYPSRATDDLLGGGQFQPTKTDTKEKYSEYDSLRTETKSPSSYTIGTGNAVNISKNTPGLTFLK